MGPAPAFVVDGDCNPMPTAARFRLFYFLYYGSVGANLPYFAVYLRGLGFSGAEIGAAQMVAPAIAGPAALAWAIAADRHRAPARALRAATACGFLAMAALPLARSPFAIGAVLLANAAFASAVVPLADALTVTWVKTRPSLSYARIRLFGSLGFIVVAVGLGVVLDARGGRPADGVVPAAILTCLGAYALVARRLPAVSSHEARPELRETFGVLADLRLVALLAACAVHWAASAPYHLMFGVFVRDLGLPARITGAGMFAGVAAEVVVLLGYPLLERRLGLGWLFATSFAGSALRWLLLSDSRAALAVVSVQLLHGLTFGLFWGASVSAMARAVPGRLRATGQALFSAIVFSGGNALGYWLSGLGYDALGGVGPLYRIAAAVEGALFVASVIGIAGSARLPRRGITPLAHN